MRIQRGGCHPVRMPRSLGEPVLYKRVHGGRSRQSLSRWSRDGPPTTRRGRNLLCRFSRDVRSHGRQVLCCSDESQVGTKCSSGWDPAATREGPETFSPLPAMQRGPMDTPVWSVGLPGPSDPWTKRTWSENDPDRCQETQAVESRQISAPAARVSGGVGGSVWLVLVGGVTTKRSHQEDRSVLGKHLPPRSRPLHAQNSFCPKHTPDMTGGWKSRRGRGLGLENELGPWVRESSPNKPVGDAGFVLVRAARWVQMSGRHYSATWRIQEPGTPLRACAPVSWNSIPEPATGSLTVDDTKTCPGAAAEQTRAAMWTANPNTSFPSVQHSPA